MKKNYEIQSIKTKDKASVASTYAQVFAGEPWKEVSKCTLCGEFSSQRPSEQLGCACGGVYSLDAYPLSETTQYVGQELSKPDAAGLFLAQATLLLQTNAPAFGFGWGFRMEPEELAQKKYKSEEMRQMITDLLIKSGFFYYVSEVGVIPSLQGLGFGKQLTNGVISSAQQRGYRSYVVRTNEDSAMRYILEKMGMTPLVGLKSGLKDSENEARVLFVGQR